jgi:hypothetical protein
VSYRDTSNYDPYASPRYGRPLRPYNWVQWTGVALMLAGLALDALYFAGRLGWVRAPVNTPIYALPPLLLGVSLINSRREEVPDLAPELAGARKRWLLIIVVLCALIFGAAIILDSTGA